MLASRWRPFARIIRRHTVTCPKRRTKFDVTTGKVVSSPKVLFLHLKIKDEPFYQAKVEGRDILVKTE